MMKHFFSTMFSSAILWGSFFCFLFYSALHYGWIQNELLNRYCMGHPIEYVTVFLFFVGMSHLGGKRQTISRERRFLKGGAIFPPISSQKENLDAVPRYLESLKKIQTVRGRSRYAKRLKAGLMFLNQGGALEDFDQELRYLSEEDAINADSDYGMVRMFIWAIPILGFLGTVMGITMALGNLNLTELETTGKLLATGLKVAFDTTALALMLVFILYFTQFWVSRKEGEFFSRLDRLVEQELKGRFCSVSVTKDNEAQSLIQATLTHVAQSFVELTQHQISLWNEAMAKIDQRSAQIAQESSKILETSLLETLQKNTVQHAETMNETQKTFMAQTIEPFLGALEEKTRQWESLEKQMVRESKILLEVLQATGDITQLEDRLNQNLRALSGSGCFEKTLSSLAAAAQLLNTRLAGTGLGSSEIRLGKETDSLLAKDAAVIVPVAKRTGHSHLKSMPDTPQDVF